MKSTKELLMILLNEYQAITPPNPLYSHNGYGFNRMIKEAVRKGVLNNDDQERLLGHLIANKPDSGTPFFWWPSREITPRIEYLNSLISKID